MSQVMSKIKQFASKLNHKLKLNIEHNHKPGESTSSRPGWMVRDSHLTNGGLRITNTAAGTFTGLITLLTIPAFFITTLFLSNINTYADSITVTLSGNPSITVAPMPEGTFADSGNININVTSTAASGYTLAITGGGSTSLIGTTDNTKSITSISSAIDQNTFNTNNSYNNKWGYKPSKHYDSSTESVIDNSNYLPSPTSNGDIIDMVNDSSSNNYTMSIGARVTSDLGFQSYENNTFVIAAVGNSKCNRAATTISEAICMQDMNDSVINSMTMNQQYQLIDERDDKTYYIAKMKDGRVWMTQNLDLDLVSDITAENYVALTSENTNLTTFGSQNYTTANGYSCSNTSTTTNCTASGETITWVPSRSTLVKSAASSWTNDSYTPYSYDYEDYYYYTNTSGTDTAYYTESACTSAHNDGTCPHYHVGNYYNFTAAVASNSTSGLTSNYTVMGNSICPAGWRLPNGQTNSSSSNIGYNGDLNYTLVAQGIISGYVGSSGANYNTNGYRNLSNNPLYIVRSGYKSGTSNPSSMGSYNYYQSNTIYSSSNIYGLYFYSSYMTPSYYYNYRNYGYPIRCIAMPSSNTGTTTVTFNKNASDATGTMSNRTYNANTFNTLPSNGFSRSGYTFKNWNTEPDGSGTTYANTAQYYAAVGTNTNNVTLYAQWALNRIITFDKNASDATGTMSTQTINAGSSASLRANSFSRSGYSFNSWNTKADGSGTKYTNQASYSVPAYNTEASTTLYAQWDKTYAITFTYDSNVSSIKILNSSGSTVGTISTSGQSLSLILNDTYIIKPTYKNGYTTKTITKTSGAGTLSGRVFTVGSGIATINFTSQAIPNMQNFSCSSLANVGDMIDVKDTRDNEVYLIGKLADNKCWMLDNLRLDPVTVSLANLQSKTNASNTTLNYLKNGGGTTSNQYATAGVANWTSGRSYSAPLVGTAYKDTTATSYGLGSGKIGVYYNYCAVTAGSYCYGDGTSAGTSSGNATEDLCPAGWQIPTNGNISTIVSAYSNKTASNPASLQFNFSITLSGYYSNGSPSSRGSTSYLPSSTRKDNNLMYGLLSASTYAKSSDGIYRERGFTIRCRIK